MSIPVFKPQHVRWLPKPITLWAVWEGTDGEHHEEALTYRDSRFYGEHIIYVAEEAHPLLTADCREDPEQVLPDTLRFIRIEDLLKLYGYVDSTAPSSTTSSTHPTLTKTTTSNPTNGPTPQARSSDD